MALRRIYDKILRKNWNSIFYSIHWWYRVIDQINKQITNSQYWDEKNRRINK